MFIFNLHCQIVLRISGNMLHKTLYLKKAGLASRNIVHLRKIKTFYVVSVSTSIFFIAFIPEFLKTGLAKIRAHSTTWQLKAIKSVQRPIKNPISDVEQ